MSVIRVKRLREETHNIRELRDIEDLVIETMGEDVWCEIMYFTEKRIEELECAKEYQDDDIESYDSSLCALRGGIREELEVIENLITKINDAKRLDRKVLTQELKGISRRLENNEAY